MMVIDNQFEIGEIVFLKTDPDGMARVVTALKICPNDQHIYQLSCGAQTSEHYGFEITQEKITC